MSALPGLSSLLAAAGPLPLTLAHFATATPSTGATITFPAGIQADDIIVMLDRAKGSGSIPASVVPAGFTSHALWNLTDSPETRQIASYKKATGSESGPLTGMNGVGQNAKVMAVFRPSKAYSTLTLGDPDGESSGNADPAAQSVLVGGLTPPLIVLGFYGANGAIATRTFSPAQDGETSETSGADDIHMKWKIYNSSPISTTVDMGNIGNNILMSGYLQAA